jgi:hypothetical protein
MIKNVNLFNRIYVENMEGVAELNNGGEFNANRINEKQKEKFLEYIQKNPLERDYELINKVFNELIKIADNEMNPQKDFKPADFDKLLGITK